VSNAAPQVTTASSDATDTTAVTARQAARAGWRRLRWFLVVALVVVLAAVITALTASVSGARDRLGPDNPAPEGSRALVQVLRRQGVAVQPVSRSTEAVAATGHRSTLLVTRTRLLGPEQLDRLLADESSNLVLVEPDEFTLSRLAPQIRTAGHRSAVNRAPGCSVAAADAAGTVRAGGSLYSLATEPISGSSQTGVCYPEPDTSGVGSYVTVKTGTRTVTVIGQSDLLTNEHFDAGGNAALGLWALGEQPSLVWYSPDPLEPAGAGQQRTPLTELLPDWVFWVVLQLAVTVLVVILWRARRLGRLVPEPLPVVVRAAETQEGRARLYRQASARGRAAATLRTSTLRRLADRLAAPAGTSPDQLVTLVSRSTGRDPAGEAALHQLLLGPAPESDSALIRLADDLDTVERELSRNRPVRST
jgi:uncharacterized protein DUF4350